MYRTLSELRDSINHLIDAQGENAPCAAFVFTQYDVFDCADGLTNKERYFSEVFTQDVLCDVGGCSYIYEEVGTMIDESIRDRKGMEIYQESVKS